MSTPELSASPALKAAQKRSYSTSIAFSISRCTKHERRGKTAAVSYAACRDQNGIGFLNLKRREQSRP